MDTGLDELRERESSTYAASCQLGWSYQAIQREVSECDVLEDVEMQ